MRFLHTSDWHLGRSLHGADLREAQQAFCDHLISTAKDEQVDAVLVSGDVYDRAIPPQWAVELLGDTLERLRATGAQVVVSAGNHDSTSRLGFASGLLAAAGVHLRTTLEAMDTPVRIAGVDVFALPYLDPVFTAPRLSAASATHADVFAAAVERVQAARTPGVPTVLMAHLFMAGSVGSSSERDVQVGGLGVVGPEAVRDFDYTALGHLHRAQAVTDTIRYCGAPLALAFDEQDQDKVHLIVDVDADGCRVREVPIPLWRRLARLRGELAELLVDPELTAHEQDWCEVTLTDVTTPAGAMDRLRVRFPHCLRLVLEPPRRIDDGRTYAERTQGRSDLELCCDFVEHVRPGAAVDAGEQSLFAEALAATVRPSEQGTPATAGTDEEGAGSAEQGVA